MIRLWVVISPLPSYSCVVNLPSSALAKLSSCFNEVTIFARNRFCSLIRLWLGAPFLKFACTWLWISFALWANRIVLKVSSIWDRWRLQVTMRVVWLLPPRDSFNNRVSFESRYGTCGAFFAMALMTLPSVERLAFIFFASSRADPWAKLLETRSEPARSTRLMVPLLMLSSEHFSDISIWQIEWDLDDNLFYLVLFTCLFCSPNDMNLMISSEFETDADVKPYI